MIALRANRIALHALIGVLLSACAGGGGGGGGGTVPVPPATGTPRPPAAPLPPLPPAAAPGSYPSLSSQEYLANWGVAGMAAAAGWQFQNGHGEGVLIGVIDDGVDPNHPELFGRISPLSVDIVAGRNALTTTQSHGSEISSIIASNFNGQQTVGPAFASTILAVRADNGSGSFNDSDLALALNYAVANGVDVVNFSLGSSSAPSLTFQNAIAAATAAGVIVIVSAGNDGPGAAQPNYPGYLAITPSISHGLVLVAGGTNPDGTFNNVSNRAGDAQNFYLVAPGWQIIVPDHGPPGPVPGFQTCNLGPNNDLCRIQGTSYASPHITAGAAMLMSAFPGLTPQQVVQILLQSTDDMGLAGIDFETGWGRLNMVRAFAPIGSVAAPLGSGLFVGTSTSLGATGAAFGDGMSFDQSDWVVSGFDTFGRTYNVDLSGNWARAPSEALRIVQAPLLWRTELSANGASVQMSLAEDIAPELMRLPAAREDLQQNPMRVEAMLAPGLTASFAAHGARAVDPTPIDGVGHLGLVNSDFSLMLTGQLNDVVRLSLMSESGDAAVGTEQRQAERRAAAVRAAFDFGGAGFDVTYGRIVEERGVLGMAWSDGLGQTPGGEIAFTAFTGHFEPARNLRLRFGAELGVADLGRSGWLWVAEPLRTSAFSFEASMGAAPTWLRPFGAEGSGVVSFTLSQPLRVDGGAFNFMAPTATAEGRKSLTYELRSIEPVPSGRELRMGLGYRYFAGDVFSAFGEALYVVEPGHIASAEPGAIVRFGFRVAH